MSDNTTTTILADLTKVVTLFSQVIEYPAGDRSGQIAEIKQLLVNINRKLSTLTNVPSSASVTGGKKKGAPRKTRKGGAEINMGAMGSQLMNTSELLQNDPSASLSPQPWDGPMPFSSGSTLPSTITTGLPDTLIASMDRAVATGGASKKKTRGSAQRKKADPKKK